MVQLEKRRQCEGMEARQAFLIIESELSNINSI